MENSRLKVTFIASIAVRIPTRAIIPKAIIVIVIIERALFDFMDCKATFRFSLKSGFKRKYLILSNIRFKILPVKFIHYLEQIKHLVVVRE
jgi:hypothetical protein